MTRITASRSPVVRNRHRQLALLTRRSRRCLCLPALPPWPLVAPLPPGRAAGAWLCARVATGARIVGACLLGFGLCGLHVAHALAQQLPLALERQDVVVSGRVVDLPARRAAAHAFRVARRRRRRRCRRVARHDCCSCRWYDEYKRDGTVAPVRAAGRQSLAFRAAAARAARAAQSGRLRQREIGAGAAHRRDRLRARPATRAAAVAGARHRRLARSDVARASPRRCRRRRRASCARWRWAIPAALDDSTGKSLRADRPDPPDRDFRLPRRHGRRLRSRCWRRALWRLFPALARRLPRPQAAARRRAGRARSATPRSPASRCRPCARC